jgi:hypothetical protein
MVLFVETIFIIGTVLTAITLYRASKKCCEHPPVREPVLVSPPMDSSNSTDDIPFPEIAPQFRSRRPKRRPKRKKKKPEEEPLLGINFILTESSFSTVQEPECAICLEPFIIDEEVKTLKCEHTFHIECIEEWFERDKTCPICRDEN